MRAVLALAALAMVIAACSNHDDPASYVTGLRVIAVKAEPPEVPIGGGTTTLTTLAIDTLGRPIGVDWAVCLDPPSQGQAINPDCITQPDGGALVTAGSGTATPITVPAIPLAALGRPDASGGVYLPLIARVSAGSDSLVASYLLRLGVIGAPNQNPTLSGISIVPDGVDGGASGGDLVPLDDTHPQVVHAGDKITLRATFQPDSAERYLIYDGDPRTTAPRQVTETLAVSWFATAGTFGGASTGVDVPDTVFHLDQARNGPDVHLPASGGTIELWAVGRDERGGTDFLHRSIQFQ
jgi:hypothetical protein